MRQTTKVTHQPRVRDLDFLLQIYFHIPVAICPHGRIVMNSPSSGQIPYKLSAMKPVAELRIHVPTSKSTQSVLSKYYENQASSILLTLIRKNGNIHTSVMVGGWRYTQKEKCELMPLAFLGFIIAPRRFTCANWIQAVRAVNRCWRRWLGWNTGPRTWCRIATYVIVLLSVLPTYNSSKITQTMWHFL